MRTVNLKAITAELVTWPEFIEYAKSNSPDPHWSFMYKGKPVTHENDSCYLIPSNEGQMLKFSPDCVLLIREDGSMFTLLSSDLNNAISK
jgi:hypothetical protein